MKATSSEKSIAALAPIGMGRMYGPISPDKRHGEDGRHHRQRGQDGRITHFIHGLDRHLKGRPGLVLRHSPVPDDVLHHHDGVVHQDADGEDQCERE